MSNTNVPSIDSLRPEYNKLKAIQYLYNAVRELQEGGGGGGSYPPSGGVPKSDLSSSVQASLDKADTSEQQSNKVTSWSGTPSDTKYPSEKLVHDEFLSIENLLDAILGSDTLHEEKKTNVVNASGTTLNAAVDNYYLFGSEVSTLDVTLVTPGDINHLGKIVFMLTTGSTPAVTFAAPTGIDVIAQDGFSIEASTTYEINAIFNGIAWVVAAMKLSTTPINS